MWSHNVVLRILARKTETVTRFEHPESYDVIKNAEFYKTLGMLQPRSRLQYGGHWDKKQISPQECSVFCGFVNVSALVSVLNLVLMVSFRQFGFQYTTHCKLQILRMDNYETMMIIMKLLCSLYRLNVQTSYFSYFNYYYYYYYYIFLGTHADVLQHTKIHQKRRKSK